MGIKSRLCKNYLFLEIQETNQRLITEKNDQELRCNEDAENFASEKEMLMKNMSSITDKMNEQKLIALANLGKEEELDIIGIAETNIKEKEGK